MNRIAPLFLRSLQATVTLVLSSGCTWTYVVEAEIPVLASSNTKPVRVGVVFDKGFMSHSYEKDVYVVEMGEALEKTTLQLMDDLFETAEFFSSFGCRISSATHPIVVTSIDGMVCDDFSLPPHERPA